MDNVKFVEVEKGELVLYKQTSPVYEGLYIKVELPYGQKLDPRIKSGMGFQATQYQATGKFAGWLAPLTRFSAAAFGGELAKKPLIGEYDLTEIRRIAADPRTYDWQKKDLLWIISEVEARHQINIGECVQVGGGKTLIGLAVCSMAPNDCIVHLPVYMVPSWEAEAKRLVLPVPLMTTYESRPKHPVKKIVVVDEVHHYKNPYAKRSETARGFIVQAQIVIGLTGTPQAAREALDLRWLNTVCAGEILPDGEDAFIDFFGKNPRWSEKEAGERVYNVHEPNGWNIELLSKFTSPHIHTVDVSELIKQIPEKQYIKVWCKHPPEFRPALQQMFTGKGVHKALSHARTVPSGFIYDDQMVPEPKFLKKSEKLDKVVDIVKNAGEPVIVVSAWKAEQQELGKRLSLLGKNVRMLTADGTQESVVRMVQAGGVDVLVASYNLMEGLNLQNEFRVMVFASNGFSPLKRCQAEGRIYRPGQKRGCLFIDVLSSGTLDEPLLNLLQQHNDLSDQMVEAMIVEEMNRLAATMKKTKTKEIKVKVVEDKLDPPDPEDELEGLPGAYTDEDIFGLA
jgi:superfamily II DNA or RNA helicase